MRTTHAVSGDRSSMTILCSAASLVALALVGCAGSSSDLGQATARGAAGAAPSAGGAGGLPAAGGASGASAGSGPSAGAGGSTGGAGAGGTAVGGAGGQAGAAPTAEALFLGDSSACALMSDRTVSCWGAADFTTGGIASTPQHVPGLADVVTMSMDRGVLCAVTTAGATKCMALPGYAYLDPWYGSPVTIEGLPSPVVEVAAFAGAGAIGRHADGTLSLWGPLFPVASLPNTDVVQVVAGGWSDRYCVRASNGMATCVVPSNGDYPVADSASDTTDIALAEYSLIALRSDGAVEVHDAPKKTHLLSAPGPVVRIAAGGPLVCALLSDGGVACGLAKGAALTPLLPAGSAKSVAVGGTSAEGFACAILVKGGVSCWGDDVSFVLGDDTVASPAFVKTGVSDVFPADVSTAFIGAATGDVSIAGWATAFVPGVHPTPAAVPEVGVGVTWLSHEPSFGPDDPEPKHAYVRDGSGALVRFEAGAVKAKSLTTLGLDTPRFLALHSLDVAVTTDGLRYSFIYPVSVVNSQGLLGNSGSSKLPLPGVTDVQFGFEHMCAMATGGMYCWGTNYAFAVSPTAANDAVIEPTLVASGATASCTGPSASCAVVSGVVTCWGMEPEPPFPTITTATAVTCGHSHACALLVDGSVRCWGANDRAQLGRGTRESIKIPATPLGLDGASTHVVQLRAGDHHTCAVTDTGDALCWGESHHGQAGSGVFGVGLPPKVVAGL